MRRHDVGNPLCKELDVRVVASSRHPIGHDRRHQRLDGAEHRDGQRRRQQRQDEVGPESREMQLGQPGRNPTEPGADRLNGQARQRHDRGPATSATM